MTRCRRARACPRDASAPALAWSGGELTYGELFALAGGAAAELDDRDVAAWPWSARSPCARSRARWAACSAAGPSCCPAAELPDATVGRADRARRRRAHARRRRPAATSASVPARARRGRRRAAARHLGLDRAAEARADHARRDRPLQRLGGRAVRDRAGHARAELLRAELRPLDPGGLDARCSTAAAWCWPRRTQADQAARPGARPRGATCIQGVPTPVLVAAGAAAERAGTRS